MSLRSRILLTVIGLVVAAIVPTVGVLAWTARQAILELTEADGTRIARLLARSAIVAVQDSRPAEAPGGGTSSPTAAQLANEIVADGNVSAIWIVDVDVNIIAFSAGDGTGIARTLGADDLYSLRAA